MLNVRYKKVLMTVCLCSLQTIFCMESDADRGSVAPQGKGLSINPVKFLNSSEKALQKTVGFVGKAASKTLGFALHHPLLTVGVAGAFLMYNPTAREFVKNKASCFGAFLWEKGKEIASKVMTDTAVMQETRDAIASQKAIAERQSKQLEGVAAAGQQHGQQLGRVERGTEELRRILEGQGQALVSQGLSLEELREEIRRLTAAQRDMAEEHRSSMAPVATGLQSNNERIVTLQALCAAMEQNVDRLGDQAEQLTGLPADMRMLRQASALQMRLMIAALTGDRRALEEIQDKPEVRALMDANGFQLLLPDEQQRALTVPHLSAPQPGSGRAFVARRVIVSPLGRPGYPLHEYTPSIRNGAGRGLIITADGSSL